MTSNTINRPSLNINKALQSETKIISEPNEKIEEKIEAPTAEKKEYQQYKSTRLSQRLLTTEGIPITFAGFEFITKTKAIIDYLDMEIARNGLPGITKGKMLSSSDKDPMQALKNKHFAEFEKMKQDERVSLAKGIKKNMGNSKPKGTENLNPVTSAQVAN